MSLDAPGLFSAVQDHALTTGLFQTVNGHEPANPPGNGLTCSVQFMRVGPVAAASGLAQMSARIEFLVRVYNPALQLPYDAIDPAVLDAASQLIGAYAGAFTLAAVLRNVDVFGAHGAALAGVGGYIKIDDSMYRTVDITLPMIINDLWAEVP